jgi:hypothetical protein
MKLDNTKRTEIIKRLYEEDHPIERVNQIKNYTDEWNDLGFLKSLINLVNLDWRPNSWISGMFKDQQVFEGEDMWCIDELIIVNAKGTQVFKFYDKFKRITFLCSDFETTTTYGNKKVNKVMLYGSTLGTNSYIPVESLELHSNSELNIDIAEENTPWSLGYVNSWEGGKINVRSNIRVDVNGFKVFLHRASNEVDLDLTNFNFTGSFRISFVGEGSSNNKVKVKLNSGTRFVVDALDMGEGNELTIEGGRIDEHLSKIGEKLKYEWRG